MRPLPWLIRTGLFAVGFGVGVSHIGSSPPQQPIVIELHIEMPDSSGKKETDAPVTEVSLPRL